MSDTDSLNSDCINDLNNIFVSLLREHRVLINKSQSPSVKLKEEDALQSMIKNIEVKCGKKNSQ